MAETPHPSASTTTLQSTITVTSTSPLNPPPGPKKDYAAAFGSLQSRYGTGGYVPNPKPLRLKPAPAAPVIPEGTTVASSSTPDRGVDSNGTQSGQAGESQKSKKRKSVLSLFKPNPSVPRLSPVTHLCLQFFGRRLMKIEHMDNGVMVLRRYLRRPIAVIIELKRGHRTTYATMSKHSDSTTCLIPKEDPSPTKGETKSTTLLSSLFKKSVHSDTNDDGGKDGAALDKTSGFKDQAQKNGWAAPTATRPSLG
ncbi:uncharacterized protein EV420DRAFT_1746983 [Desarmillaria tabescens]|uniref:Uncharacterized protein n=1 Tax=Armillaria tabescens TaxID=1929756 RepID=A0AA39N6J3_ARMTA|nr:uncharacterized protein EV420DRAFT_1746983 [Desarmillaria tabescens]KAK0459991.1 hypothetical protein EV420DRAFT_1746983 [Desarmillaria tabescens]